VLTCTHASSERRRSGRSSTDRCLRSLGSARSSRRCSRRSRPTISQVLPGSARTSPRTPRRTRSRRRSAGRIGRWSGSWPSWRTRTASRPSTSSRPASWTPVTSWRSTVRRGPPPVSGAVPTIWSTSTAGAGDRVRAPRAVASQSAPRGGWSRREL